MAELPSAHTVVNSALPPRSEERKVSESTGAAASPALDTAAAPLPSSVFASPAIKASVALEGMESLTDRSSGAPCCSSQSISLSSSWASWESKETGTLTLADRTVRVAPSVLTSTAVASVSRAGLPVTVSTGAQNSNLNFPLLHEAVAIFTVVALPPSSF